MRLSWMLPYIILCSLAHVTTAQEIKTRDLQVIGEEFQLSFMISPDHSLRERYNVSVYASHDNFETPLGLNIKDVAPGELKTIKFPIVETIGYYRGQIQFRLEADATFFPIEILPTSTTSFRKNKRYQVNWNDYNELGIYDIHLYHQDTIISLANSVTGSAFASVFPKGLDAGKFHIVVSPTTNPGLVSDDFAVTIKRNLTTVIALSAVLVGGTGILLLTGGGGETPGNGQLPDPPGTPN